MEIKLLLLGLFLGFAGSIPLAGPIAILVFNQSLKSQFHAARSIALGAAVAEAIYAILALLGMALLLENFPIIYQIGIILGAITFIILGFIFWRMNPHLNLELQTSKKTKRNYFLGFSITILNPTLLLNWSSTIIFLLSFVTLKVDLVNSLFFGLGVFVGIFAWFSIAVFLIKKYREKISDKIIKKLYKAFSLLMFFLAIQYFLKLI